MRKSLTVREAGEISAPYAGRKGPRYIVPDIGPKNLPCQ